MIDKNKSISILKKINLMKVENVINKMIKFLYK